MGLLKWPYERTSWKKSCTQELIFEAIIVILEGSSLVNEFFKCWIETEFFFSINSFLRFEMLTGSFRSKIFFMWSGNYKIRFDQKIEWQHKLGVISSLLSIYTNTKESHVNFCNLMMILNWLFFLEILTFL